MLPPAVLWVDPGGMTGTGILRTSPPEVLFAFSEHKFMEACQVIEVLCMTYGSLLAIGWERFTVNANTHKLTPQPEALHVIGVCRYLSAKHRCRVLPEAQQHTPEPFEQEQLRALGWWVPGKDDAQSAACHTLRWLMQSGNLPPKEREILARLGR